MTPSPEPRSKESGQAVGASANNLRDTTISGNGHFGGSAGDTLSMPRAASLWRYEACRGKEDPGAALGAVLTGHDVEGLLAGIERAQGSGQCFEFTREVLQRHLRKYSGRSQSCTVKEGIEVIGVVTHEVERKLHQHQHGTHPRARQKGDNPQAHSLLLLKLSAETPAAEQWVLELEHGLEQHVGRTGSLKWARPEVGTEPKDACAELGAFVDRWQGTTGEYWSKCPEPLRELVEQALIVLKRGSKSQANGPDWVAICLRIDFLGKSLASYRRTSIYSVGQLLPKRERDLLAGRLQELRKVVARAALGPLGQELSALSHPSLRGELALCRHVASSLRGALVNSTTLSSGDRFNRDLSTIRQHPHVVAEPRLSDILSALHFVLATLGPELSKRRGGDEG